MAQPEKTTVGGTNGSGTALPPGFEKKQHVNTRSIVIICFITLSSAAYGYAASIIATTLTQPSFVKHMKLDTAPNASGLIGAMNGLFYAGGACGSMCAGWVSNKYGRKASVALANMLLLFSGALLTASVNPAMFIVFRFFSGFGCFVIMASVPLWIAELAQPKVRGILTDIHAVFMMLGYAIACYVGLGFYFVKGSNQWRGPIALQMVLPTVILCGLYWMPESPRYLLSKGRVEEGRAIIYRMHYDPSDPTGEFVKREFYQMQKQIELDRTFATSYWEIFTRPSMRKRALITMFLEFSLMSSGVLVILNYGSIIWRSLGFNTVQILHFQCGFQLTGLVFNILAMAFVDRVKRPHLIAGGFFVTACVMSAETALQKFYLNSSERAGLIACTAMIFLFQTTYSLFLDGSSFFYVAEIWPSHVRSQGFAIAMATMSLTNLTWLEAAPTAFETIGWRYYLFFICLPALASVIVLLFFKDTLHKPLEEIAGIFGDAEMVAVYQHELDLGGIPVDALEATGDDQKGHSGSSDRVASTEVVENAA